MTTPFAAITLILVTFLISACSSSPKPPDSARQGPPLELEKYLAGHTRSWGVIEDRFGKTRDQFTVDLFGEQRGQTFHLHQKFLYASGKTQERTWQIRRLDATRYESTATDIQGKAHAWIEGSAVHLKYTMTVPMGKRRVNVQFNQWIWRHPGGIVFNRADIRKFGIRLVRVSEFFAKPD
jgi:hypothetical protein